MKVFIAGMTGHVGGAAAQVLVDGGHSLRALVRSPARAEKWAEAGVELVEGDLRDASSIARALEGVEAAFVMMPPDLVPGEDFARARAFGKAAAEALALRPVQRVVALSSFGAEVAEGTGLIRSAYEFEHALAGVPNVAFVRAGSFLDNYAWARGAAAATGVFDTFLTPSSLEIPMVASKDIGAVVAELMTSSWKGTRVIELGTLTSAEALADAIGRVLGKTVVARSIPRERWTAALEGMGVPKGMTSAYEQMLEASNAGVTRFGAKGAERVEAMSSPEAFFREI